jgi:branched-chain amino acid transport system substrate-binding protein
MKKVLSLVLACTMLVAVLAGCGGSNAASSAAVTEGAIKIGGIGPTTGSVAVYGLATQRGAEIAIEEINAKGGLQFEMDYQDDQGDGEKGVSAYYTLKDWGAQMIYGCTTSGSCAAVAAETYNDRMFQLTPSASSTDVTAGRDNVFQMCFTDPNQGYASAQYIKDNNLGSKIAVIYNNADAYSTGIYTAFASKAAELGLEIVSTTTFPADTHTDFTVQVTDAKTAGADLIFLPIYYTPASLILAQAKAIDYTPTFFGCDGMDGLLTLEGFEASLAEGLMLMTPFNATSDSSADFVAKYEAAYNETPNQFAADGYDCIYAIAAACEKAGITADMKADEVCEKMIATFTDAGFSVDGLTGSGMTWSTAGEISKDPVVVKIVDGAYVNM